MQRLQRAVTAVIGAGERVVRRGAQFDSILAAAGLAALPFDHGELFLLLDADESGALDRAELLSGLALLLAPRLSPRGRLALLFDAFDVGCSGGLSRLELRAVLEAAGIVDGQGGGAGAAACDAQTLDALFDALDSDRSGAVSFDELCAGIECDERLRAHLLVPVAVPPSQQQQQQQQQQRQQPWGGVRENSLPGPSARDELPPLAGDAPWSAGGTAYAGMAACDEPLGSDDASSGGLEGLSPYLACTGK